MTSRKGYAPYILRKPNDFTVAKCINCLEEKPPNGYYRHSFRGDGFVRYRQICKSCRTKKERKIKSRPIHSKILELGMQKCKYCNIEKPLSCFYANGCFSDGVKKYRTRCKDCVLLISKNNHIDTYEKKIIKKHFSVKNYISSLLNRCSKRKNKEFNIDIQYLIDLYNLQNGLCNISGVPMTHEYGSRVTNISIDRVDSSKGYIKGNIYLVCYIVNIMKNQFSINELIEFAKKIVIYSQNNHHAEVEIQNSCLAT